MLTFRQLENQAISNGRALVATRAYRQDGVLVAIAVRVAITCSSH